MVMMHKKGRLQEGDYVLTVNYKYLYLHIYRLLLGKEKGQCL